MKAQALLRVSVALLLLAPPPGRAWSQDLRTNKDDSGAARLREMARQAAAIAIRTTDAGGGPVECAPDPVFRYDDQPRRIEDATLWIYGRGGRPSAALKVEIYPDMGIEGLVSLSTEPISADWSDLHWVSTAPGIELRPVADAPAPAGTPRERLTQLKAIAARFSGFELEPPNGRLQMRMLPKPILRYDDAPAGLLDEAIFSLAYGVNPEVLVVIEARKAAGTAAPTWQYGFGRLGGTDVSVSLDGREVWKQGAVAPVPQSRATYMNRNLKRVAEGG